MLDDIGCCKEQSKHGAMHGDFVISVVRSGAEAQPGLYRETLFKERGRERERREGRRKEAEREEGREREERGKKRRKGGREKKGREKEGKEGGRGRKGGREREGMEIGRATVRGYSFNSRAQGILSSPLTWVLCIVICSEMHVVCVYVRHMAS